jgi:hypothetical protein
MDDSTSAPYSYNRDDARRRVTVVARDELTRDDFMAILDRQVSENTWSYAVLYDLRDMSHAVVPADVDAIAARVYRYLMVHGARGPVAVVTTAFEVIGATRSYALGATRAGVEVQLFWDVPEAERWLEALQRLQA